MKKMVGLMLVGLMLTQGCASLLVNQGLQNRHFARVKADGGQLQAGFNLFDLGSASEAPLATLLAAAADIGTGAGLYYLLKELEKDDQPTYQWYAGRDLIWTGDDYDNSTSGQ